MSRSAHLLAPLAALLALGALLAVGGCGQKGSLFLPDRKQSPVPATGPAVPSGAPAPAAPSVPATPPGAVPRV
jgi:predicted small lipoprotein YifL